LLAVQTKQSVCCADPEITVIFTCQTAGVVVQECWFVGMIENPKGHSIKSSYAAFCSNPDESIAGLDNLMHTILR
jgi:hypothetical protein